MFRWNRARWFWTGAIGLGVLPVLAIFALAIFLFWNAADAAAQVGPRELAATEWLPQQSRYGVTRLLAGTLAVTVLALCLAVPIALSSAGYLSLYAGRKVRAVANA